jgi:hypothetical protein
VLIVTLIAVFVSALFIGKCWKFFNDLAAEFAQWMDSGLPWAESLPLTFLQAPVTKRLIV